MKDYGKLFATWLFSMVGSLLIGTFWMGSYQATMDAKIRAVEREDIELIAGYKRMESEGTRALQSHVVDNSRELKDMDRRVSHCEVIIESLSDLKADVREIKVRIGDVQERQKRIEEKNKQ